MWSGPQACMGRAEADRGHITVSVPDTGSTPYTPTVLPSIDSTDEVCATYDAWITMQAGNGEPGEGSPEWEDFIRHLVEIFPDAVEEGSESKRGVRKLMPSDSRIHFGPFRL